MRTHSFNIHDIGDLRPSTGRTLMVRYMNSDLWFQATIGGDGKYRNMHNKLLDDTVVEWFYDDEQYPKPDDDGPERV